MPFIKMVGAEAHWYPNAQERDTPSPCRASLIVAVCRTFVIFCRFLYRSLASETMSPAFKKSPGLSEAIQGAGTPLLGRNEKILFLSMSHHHCMPLALLCFMRSSKLSET